MEVEIENNQFGYEEQQSKNKTLSKIAQKKFIFGDGFISVLFATWLSPIISTGFRIPIDFIHFPFLRQQDQNYSRLKHFSGCFQRQSRLNSNKSPGWILIKSIYSYQKKQEIIFILYSILLVLTQTCVVIFNEKMIRYIQEQQRNFNKNVILLSGYILLTIFQMILSSYSYYRYNHEDSSLASTLSLAVYNKTLKYPLLCSKKFELAQILNFSQVDSNTFKLFHWYTRSVFTTILQVFVSFGLICYYFGPRLLICLGLLVVMMIIAFIFVGIFHTASDQFYATRDRTIKVCEQMISMIKFIKLNVLEDFFLEKISSKRKQQLNSITKTGLILVAIAVIFELLCPLLIITAFIVQIIFGRQIKTSQAFLILMIFNSIQIYVKQFPQSMKGIINVWISAKRLGAYLLARQIDSRAIVAQKANINAIQIKNGNFYWEKYHKKEKQTFEQKQKENYVNQTQKLEAHLKINPFSDQYINTLRDVNIEFKNKELVVILGSIGSGKSSLFYSILNQTIPRKSSKTILNGQIAYCSQTPWIFNGSVKDNVVFFQQYDETRFYNSLWNAGLERDIKTMERGVQTQIGQRGVNLSGGQRARISLARALYSNKEIYLFDDVLSALDVAVTNFVIQNAIKKSLISKTVIISTHDPRLLSIADRVFEIIDNKLIQLPNRKQELNQICQTTQQTITFQPSLLNNQQIDNIILPQFKEKGEISLDLYQKLISLCGGKFFIVPVLIVMICWAFLSYATNMQIKNWCELNQKSSVYLYLYFAFAVQSTVLIVIFQIILILGQNRKNLILHQSITQSLLFASLVEFFYRVPSGRILNRLSNDMYDADFIIVNKLKPVLKNISIIFSVFIACLNVCSIMALAPVIIIVAIFCLLYYYITGCNQQCIRLNKISLSPVVEGISELVKGIETVRAYKKTEAFLKNQANKMNLNKRIWAVQKTIQYWFIIRLQFISYIAIYCLIGFCLFSAQQNGPSTGVLLLYTMIFIEQTGYFFTYILNFRVDMTSFQRLIQLTCLQKQHGYDLNRNEQIQHQNQPNNNYAYSIQFVNYCTKYRKGRPFVLKNINLRIKKGTKLGIIGRTGAGKSTLINSLLRIIEPTEGSLFIKGTEIREYDLKQLRKLITVIDQDATLISSTFRDTLDTSYSHSDQEIMKLLRQCGLQNFLKQKGGLDSVITNNNTSVGQKQLICICRALLKKSEIVLIDEATANVDVNHTKIVQSLIDRTFKNKTVLTIAHRLSTLENCDEILVLDAGEIVQWGLRTQLLRNNNSIYKRMKEMNDKSYLT